MRENSDEILLRVYGYSFENRSPWGNCETDIPYFPIGRFTGLDTRIPVTTLGRSVVPSRGDTRALAPTRPTKVCRRKRRHVALIYLRSEHTKCCVGRSPGVLRTALPSGSFGRDLGQISASSGHVGPSESFDLSPARLLRGRRQAGGAFHGRS
jgi:hypothetical protein